MRRQLVLAGVLTAWCGVAHADPPIALDSSRTQPLQITYQFVPGTTTRYDATFEMESDFSPPGAPSQSL
ncbi:MAG: hypothetical protein KC561_15450, partial [Myxococcales bacterium]|nr:hypothetical protein [Myxococcales bacterium]